MPELMTDYSGGFKTELALEDFEHDLLAGYGREIMLANHIHDRAALLQVTLQYGLESQTAVACDEWMGSSPIYNARNRALLNMQDDDVATVFKCLQVDIGAPHNFLEFHYEIASPEEGFFWTTSCGPYNHVRRMTNADPHMETQICHHMEDPTFDATVMAVNPRMRCRPVYRPPYGEVPEGGPCRWRVAIEYDIGMVEDNPTLNIVRQSLAADFKFREITADTDGMTDYAGEFRRDFVLSDLAHNVLARQCKEFALDVHLLNRACYTSIAERWGEDVLGPLAVEQWRSMAPVTVHRLRKAFDITGDSMSSVLKVLQLNPFLPREYLKLGFELLDETSGRIWIEDCAALQEVEARGIISLMTHHPETPGFDAMAKAVNSYVQVAPLDPAAIDGAKLAWEIIIDKDREADTPSEYAGLVAGADLMGLDNSVHQYHYV
jgi:hypothetical protein